MSGQMPGRESSLGVGDLFISGLTREDSGALSRHRKNSARRQWGKLPTLSLGKDGARGECVREGILAPAPTRAVSHVHVHVHQH